VAGPATAPPAPVADKVGGSVPLRRRVIHLVVVDILVLAELATAVFFASRHEEQFTLVFMAVFFGLLIPTLSMSRLVSRRWVARCQEPGSA